MRIAPFFSGDPLDQGYFPVGESLNILNTNRIESQSWWTAL